jgi:hypothetical protein
MHPLWKIVCQVFIIIHIKAPCDPMIPPLNIYPGELKKDTYNLYINNS